MKQHLQQFAIFLLSMVVISLGLFIIPIGVFLAFSKYNLPAFAYFAFILVYSTLLTCFFDWAADGEL